MPCGVETLDEMFNPPLPGSEQLRLQQSRAIETSGVLLADCAFLQQSGKFDEASFLCEPMPTAPVSIAATIMNTVSPLRIVELTILSEFLRCQAAG